MKYNKSNRFLSNTIVPIIIFLSFVFVSCEYNKNENASLERKKEIADSTRKANEEYEKNKPCNRIGKYVYIDQLDVLHTRLHCGGINDGGTLSGSTTDENGEEVEVSSRIKCGSGIERIKLKDLDKSLLENSCHNCIDDDMYDYLKKYGSPEGLLEEQITKWIK